MLQPCIDRQADVAMALADGSRVRVIGLVTVAEKRQHLAIVTPLQRHTPALSVGGHHDGGVVVEPAQRRLLVPFEVGGVGRAPVHPRRCIPEQMKRLAAERIASGRLIEAGPWHIDAGLAEGCGGLTRDARIACGQRQAGAIVDPYRAAASANTVKTRGFFW